MSYILDALKKADRERNLSKVPTLTTVHIPVYVTGRRIAVWAVAGVLLCGGLLAWFLRPSPTEPPGSRVQARPRVGVTAPAGPADAEREPAAREELSVPSRALTEAASPGPVVAPRPEAPRHAERDRAASPPPSRAAPRQPSQPPPAPVRPEVADVRPVGPEPTVSPSPRPEPQPSVEAGRPRTEVAPVAPAATSPAPPTLLDASAKMTLDVFVYTDVEADRMAVINGRRYVKGQLVDGLYLVEGITPEGVVLSHRGDRVVLRP